ncbi:sigma-54-dependent Fis family transcriptional regulator [Acidaminobacter sp. JC074]|uniref:sigma-54 interaction domain-containing protein n=1 Tax=Acidaminobacter sp. JC074 TaxID=2530199 RepID=UPI001F10EE2D|nr:sigma 54-interacting transcriptional regulator [Acidaminobacter sp. JC074]
MNNSELRLQLEMIDDFIEEAYEGMVIVDQYGIIMRFKYEKVLGIKEEDAIGRHVKDVIKTTRLHKVLESGLAEIGNIQVVDNKTMITSRVPIKRGDQIVGAIGTIMFKDLSDLTCMYNQVESFSRDLTSEPSVGRGRYTFSDLLTQDSSMKVIIKKARIAASSMANVSIMGESGTGKEYLAHAIHNASKRSYGPFVEINCGGIPAELIESELFGYEGGTFTGGLKSGKAGKFEFANGGTIFLDEIASMPLAMQAKLLRVLEERQFQRIGGNENIRVDVRIISASNEDLKELVKQGRFREDLFYRLDVISLNLPPLRERPEDIDLLINNFFKEFNLKYSKNLNHIPKKVKLVLNKYDWPGNVRQLRNCMESLVVLSSHPSQLFDNLPKDILVEEESKSFDLDLRSNLEVYEAEIIKKAVLKCSGNKSRAAKMLGLHRSLLYKKIDKLGIRL